MSTTFFASPFPGRSASASPAELVCYAVASPSSATGAILSLLTVIVNVFLVFYLFQTIHAILTVSAQEIISILGRDAL